MPYKVFLPGAFKSVLKHYKKKYPHAGEDLKQILHLVVNNPDIGKSLQGLEGVKKVRFRNSDVQKGKSGGYRLVYLLEDTRSLIVPLLMYSKSNKASVTEQEIRSLLTRIEQDISDDQST